jgi:hypothetical protein
MSRLRILVICFLLTGGYVRGQSGFASPENGDLLENLQSAEVSGQIDLELDSLLEANYYKLLIQNSKVTGIPGYRIRIYSETGLGAKEEQQRIRARFLSLYPGIDAYSRYDEPYFKVYVGDCRTRSEALKLYEKVARNFPNAIIGEDHIKIKSME